MKSHTCPGCKRERSTCWIMPCLYLEQLKERGAHAVDRWLRVVGNGQIWASGYEKGKRWGT